MKSSWLSEDNELERKYFYDTEFTREVCFRYPGHFMFCGDKWFVQIVDGINRHMFIGKAFMIIFDVLMESLKQYEI